MAARPVWQTRSHRIRTAAETSLSLGLIDQAEAPLHVRIAEQTQRLAALGFPLVRIAVELGVSDNTVAKALRTSQSGNPGSPDV